MGKMEKAVLHCLTRDQWWQLAVEAAQNKSNKFELGNALNDVLKDAANSAIGAIADKVAEKAIEALDDATGNALSTLGEMMQSISYLIPNHDFHFQFNPSRLRINGQSPGLEVFTGITTSESKTTSDKEQVKEPPKLFLDIDFIVDQSDGIFADADAIGGVVNVAVEKVGQMLFEKTVTDNVQELLYLLEHKYYNIVRFQWGKMSFMGTLEKVDLTYTMFTKVGEPIRAKVHIRIKHLAAADTLKEWQDAFLGKNAVENAEKKVRATGEKVSAITMGTVQSSSALYKRLFNL